MFQAVLGTSLRKLWVSCMLGVCFTTSQNLTAPVGSKRHRPPFSCLLLLFSSVCSSSAHWVRAPQILAGAWSWGPPASTSYGCPPVALACTLGNPCCGSLPRGLGHEGSGHPGPAEVVQARPQAAEPASHLGPPHRITACWRLRRPHRLRGLLAPCRPADLLLLQNSGDDVTS